MASTEGDGGNGSMGLTGSRGWDPPLRITIKGDIACWSLKVLPRRELIEKGLVLGTTVELINYWSSFKRPLFHCSLSTVASAL